MHLALDLCLLLSGGVWGSDVRRSLFFFGTKYKLINLILFPCEGTRASRSKLSTLIQIYSFRKLTTTTSSQFLSSEPSPKGKIGSKQRTWAKICKRQRKVIDSVMEDWKMWREIHSI